MEFDTVQLPYGKYGTTERPGVEALRRTAARPTTAIQRTES